MYQMTRYVYLQIYIDRVAGPHITVGGDARHRSSCCIFFFYLDTPPLDLFRQQSPESLIQLDNLTHRIELDKTLAVCVDDLQLHRIGVFTLGRDMHQIVFDGREHHAHLFRRRIASNLQQHAYFASLQSCCFAQLAAIIIQTHVEMRWPLVSISAIDNALAYVKRAQRIALFLCDVTIGRWHLDHQLPSTLTTAVAAVDVIGDRTHLKGCVRVRV